MSEKDEFAVCRELKRLDGYDATYGEAVLEKMYEKAQKAIIILEIFDKATKAKCEKYRRAMLDDYDEKYAGLDKMFYDRDMFRRFAEKHECCVKMIRYCWSRICYSLL